MKLRLITIAFDPETGRFLGEPLREIEGEVVSVVEHFFQHSGVPHVLLIVHYSPPREARPAARPERAPAFPPPAPAAVVRAEAGRA